MTWQNDFSNSIRSLDEASLFFDHPFDEAHYPIFIPKSFAKKIKALGPESVLWKQFLPNIIENEKSTNSAGGLYDPIGDKIHSKGNQIIHRYANRVLFTPTTVCPIACRYCFRKNELANHDKIFEPHFNETLNYLRENTEINEIIFSGGDPLILTNEKLANYLEEFSKIENIKYIRFHTRLPIILPSRIDGQFIDVLKKYSKKFNRLMLMIHVNHAAEIDAEVADSFLQLNENGIELFSQTVLLKDVNNNTDILKELFLKLSDLKVTPYYLHHPDQVLGAMHFYISLEEGRKIFAPLHNQLPGWALPQYVIDIPGGEGKTSAFNPENFSFSGKLINRNGLTVTL